MQLHEIPHIKLNIEMRFNPELKKNELERLLRMFKPQTESLEADCIYSPCFDDNPLILGDDFGERSEMLRKLTDFLPLCCAVLRINYDFSLSPVNISYQTDGEFSFIGDFLERVLQGTNLSLLMLLSHFNQAGDRKSSFTKPEHFHAVIGNPDISGTELDLQMNLLMLKLKKQPIVKKIILKEK